MLTPFQQLLMQATGAMTPPPGQSPAPQQAAMPPPPQQPGGSAAPRPYGESRVDRLLKRYDQFAGGGMNMAELSPQQRSLLRRQLGINVVGAMMQNQPVATGLNTHLAAVDEQRKQMAAAQRQQAMQAIFAGGGQPGQSGAPGALPMAGGGAGGAPMQGGRARAVNQYNALLQAGLFEDAAEFAKQLDAVYPDETFTDADIVLDEQGNPVLVRQGNRGSLERLDYRPAIEASQANLIDRVEGINPITGETMWARGTGMTPYQRASLGQQERKLAMDEANAGGAGPGNLGPETVWDQTTKILYRREGDKWKPDPTFGKRYDAAQAGLVRFQNLADDAQRLASNARSLANDPALARVTGAMSMVPSIPGGEAATAASNLEALRSQLSVAALNRMREMSATGGAVGQVTEREWPRLEAALQNLNAARKYEDVQRSLTALADLMDDITAKYEAAANTQFAPILAVDNDGRAPTVKFGRSAQAEDEWTIEETD